jgi:archaellum component FlaC
MNQDEISEKLVEVDARSKSNKHRLDKVEERQDNLEQLTNAFTKMETEQSYIKKDVSEIKADVKTLAEKPVKRWESIVERVLTVVVGAVVGYLFSGGWLP